MSTQPYPPSPLFTPGVVLGIIVFLLTCGTLVFGYHHTGNMKTENEKRASEVSKQKVARDEIEKNSKVQAYRLYERNKQLIYKQRKFSDIPSFFETLATLKEETKVSFEWFVYAMPLMHTSARVVLETVNPAKDESPTEKAVDTTYAFLALFRDGFYKTLSPVPSPEKTDDDVFFGQELDSDIELEEHIETYGTTYENTPAYFTLDFVPSFSLGTDTFDQKALQFAIDFRLKDIID